MAETKKSIFETLSAINCNDHTEKKNGLTYLAWAFCWAELKKAYPDSYYTVYENEKGWNYFTDGKTAWVKTGVTVVDGDIKIEHIEYLPVMDFRNKSIPVEQLTSFDVNKTIQRSLTKACARHGLGLYIYAGEDLPEEASEELKKLQVTVEGMIADGTINDANYVQRAKQYIQAGNVDGLQKIIGYYAEKKTA